METVRANLSHLRPIRLAPTDVAVCVATAVRNANLPVGVRVDLEGLDTLPTVMAGAQSLSLVFTNLFVNAADAMKGSGLITTTGIAHDDWVEVAVTDDGPGIPPDLHDRIFEFSFSGRGPARTGKLGFGLWWVKTLMVRLGGSVHVESDGHHGTTFRLKLPRVDRTLRVVSPSAHTPPSEHRDDAARPARDAVSGTPSRYGASDADAEGTA
jgi:signal transduction histidine kinase